MFEPQQTMVTLCMTRTSKVKAEEELGNTANKNPPIDVNSPPKSFSATSTIMDENPADHASTSLLEALVPSSTTISVIPSGFCAYSSNIDANICKNNSYISFIDHANADVTNDNSVSSSTHRDSEEIKYDGSVNSSEHSTCSASTETPMIEKVASTFDDVFHHSTSISETRQQHASIETSDENFEVDIENKIKTNILLSNLILKLRHNQQHYGENSIHVAESYNAIGIIECRIYKNYTNALWCHNKSLRIITILHLQNKEISEVSAHFQNNDFNHCNVTSNESKQYISERTNDNRGRKSPTCIPHSKITTLFIMTYIDMGTCYELQHNYDMAIQCYEQAEMYIYSNSNYSTSDVPINIPKNIIFSCRRAIARVKRL